MPRVSNLAVARWFMTFEEKPKPVGKLSLRFGVSADPEKLGMVERTHPPRPCQARPDDGVGDVPKQYAPAIHWPNPYIKPIKPIEADSPQEDTKIGRAHV